MNEDRWSVEYIDRVLDAWYDALEALPESDRLLREGKQMFIEAGLIKE